MTFMAAFYFAYFLFAALFVMMTWEELHRTGGRPLAATAAGFLACILWPLTAIIVLTTMYRRTT